MLITYPSYPVYKPSASAMLRTNGPENARRTWPPWEKHHFTCSIMCVSCQLQIGTYQEHCQWHWQEHLPSASIETEPHAAFAVDLQQALREFRMEWRILLQGIWLDRSLDSRMFLGTDFMTSILASPHISVQSSSVQFSHSVMTNSLWSHGLQHARPPCPSPTPGVYSNWCPLSRWCHPTISSSAVPFSSCLQSCSASVSFQMSQFFTSDGQNIGVSASTSVLPINFQYWFPLGWTGWISLQSKGLSRIFSTTTIQKYQFFNTQLSL